MLALGRRETVIRVGCHDCTMASDPVTALAARPLAFMDLLSPIVHVYRPDEVKATKPTPKLILLATWMGAGERHIAKYVAGYQALYPAAPILLLRSEPGHFIHPGSGFRDLAPAVPFFRSVFPGTDGTASSSATTAPPPLLIHAWSNGGTASLHNLRHALTSSSVNAHSAQPFPRHTLVLDSTPGQYRYWPSYLAFTAGLSGAAFWLAAPFVHLICALYWLHHEVIGRGLTGPLAVVARAMNDDVAAAAAKGGLEVRRTYVYGPGDKLVDWRDVERHADEAERKGFAVRRERFEGSGHVAHARADAERYWRIVSETWEGR